MSPNSAWKAEKLGYTNVKVYHEGLPVWSKSNYSVLSAVFLKEAWIDKDMPHVLLDVRAPKEAEKGFIKGAVSLLFGKNAVQSIARLDVKKNAPIIVYGDKDEKQAVTVAKGLLKAGYGNVKILNGGFGAWEAAKYDVVNGKLAAKATFVPKPRPGEIALDEFKKYASELPSNVMIIDVRSQKEGNAGMLKTAKLIPLEEIKERVAEIPKDKLIITLCNTGVLAEMAYHVLKDQGYTNVKFVNATFNFEKNGNYKISID